jgi:metallo-beta-lactamase family protein
MVSLQRRLSELGAAPSPGHVPTPVTPVETQAFDE